MNQRHAELLELLGAGSTSHSRRTLMAHLTGTHELLEQWKNPPATCLAGLFHSIYGTYAFDKQSADLSMRERIRDCIGAPAEQLVYIFCVTDRRSFYDHLGESRFELRDIVHDCALPLDRATLAALIEIEVANMVEQIPYRSKKKARRAAEWYADAFAPSRDYMSAAAASAAQRCFNAVLADSDNVNEATL
jgi:hypothetical protein